MKTTRREFLSKAAMYGLGAFATGMGLGAPSEASAALNPQDFNSKIREILPQIHVANVITNTSELGERSLYCQGIIHDGKYLTMAHRILENDYQKHNFGVERVKSLTVNDRKLILGGEELEQIVLNPETGIAIYDFPCGTDLPDFPLEISRDLMSYKPVYLVVQGFPKPKIYSGNIKSPNNAGLEITKGDFETNFYFDESLAGCPVFNTDLELLGLADMSIGESGFVKKIDQYLKRL